MTPTRYWEPPRFWKTLASAAGLTTAGTGLLVLSGWLLHIEWLTSLDPHWVAMKTNTAVCFICAGLALSLIARQSGTAARANLPLTRILAMCVALIGALSLFEYLTAIDLGIDQWLVHEAPNSIGTLAPGRMAPASALLFVFTGIALLLHDQSARSSKQVSVLALLIGLPTLLSGFIYLYDIDNIYGLGYFMQLAAHTVTSFLLLAVGLLCAQPEHGLVALIRSRDTGGAIVRRLLPVTVIAPIAIDWLKLSGERHHLYEPDLGTALVALGYILILGTLMVWVARYRSRAETERDHANAVIAASEARLRTLLRTIPDLIWMKDPQGIYLACNHSFERFFGKKEGDIVGKTDYDFVDRQQADFFRANDLAAISLGKPRSNEEWLTFADTGERILAETTKAPVVDELGRLQGVLGIARDITFRQQAADLTQQAQLETQRLLQESNRSRQILLAVLEDSKTATEALRKSEEKLRQLNEELEQRVRDRTAKLEAANKELEAFSYSVSHDLRAPLRAITGFVELLRKYNYDSINDKGRHYMDVISESAVQMGQLIDDILTFSRIGRVEMTLSRVRLDLVLDSVLNTLRPQSDGRNIEWKIAPLPEVNGERTMLSLVLQNLVANALKFTRTREKTVIEIGQVEGKPGEVVCYVKDNGVGFDMQYTNKLFGLFQRLHAQEQFEGTGVGLANVQRIIQRHGGRVWAESKLNEGATFYFALPQSGES